MYAFLMSMVLTIFMSLDITFGLMKTKCDLMYPEISRYLDISGYLLCRGLGIFIFVCLYNLLLIIERHILRSEEDRIPKQFTQNQKVSIIIIFWGYNFICCIYGIIAFERFLSFNCSEDTVFIYTIFTWFLSIWSLACLANNYQQIKNANSYSYLEI